MESTYKQYEVLKRASLFLEKYQREPYVAELLLQHHLGVGRSKFYAQMQETISTRVAQAFEEDLFNHATTGVPIQHLIGVESFYGRDFLVNKDVLIPRPETEELVLHVINTIKNKTKNESLTVVDVGTGSGIIAITLALEIPKVNVYATDLSEKALEVAKKNAETHQADVTFLQGDFLSPVIDHNLGMDIIVSNPPYISGAEKPELADTVKNFDPALALFADDDGLGAYKKIISQIPHCLNKDGSVFFEIGHQQGNAVCERLKRTYPKSNPTVIKDINQNDRIVAWS